MVDGSRFKMPEDVLILGAQGAGKGTQARKLAKFLDNPYVGFGSLLKSEAEAVTLLGARLLPLIARGELVPADLLEEILVARLKQEDAGRGVVIDGFPRTLSQAALLDDVHALLGRKVWWCIHLKISDHEIARRLAGRVVCEKCGETYHGELLPPPLSGRCDLCGGALGKRTDDKAEILEHRLHLYREMTLPVLECYRSRNLLCEIDGARSTEEVFRSIVAALGVGPGRTGSS
jgi:adenylate kinase